MIISWLPQATKALAEQTKWLEENRGHRIVQLCFEQVHAAVKRLRADDLILYKLYDAERNIHYFPVNRYTQLYYRSSEDKI